MNESILVAIGIVLVVTVAAALLFRIRSKKAESVEWNRLEEKEHAPEEKTDVATDPHTEDEKYAQRHNCWICRYCETINPYPDEYVINRDALVVRKTIGPMTGLRGDLLDRMYSDNMLWDAGELICIACGKKQ